MGSLRYPRAINLRPPDGSRKPGEPAELWYPTRQDRHALVVAVIEDWTPTPHSKEWLRGVFRRNRSHFEGSLAIGAGAFVIVPRVAACPVSVVFALHLACIGITSSRGCLIVCLALSGLSLFLRCGLG